MKLTGNVEPRTLIDELLADQQQLTAVDRFASARALIAPATRYRELIPSAQPQPGQQYAFEVDLDKCTGCKACVSACHSLNGLDDGETWRDVGLLFSSDWKQPYQQTITTACHHCVDPGCLNGCPVLAYDKDPVTGIVRHLDDQCIGCQYCVMKCPYEVPKYSAKRGIVRKCDMCVNRLAVGEAPACAQACPSEAIRITIVDQSALVAAAESGNFLPGSPSPKITVPSTRYKTSRAFPRQLLPGDHASLTPSDPHLPLVFMLVLTQLSVGASVAAVFTPSRPLGLLALTSLLLALAVAGLHLGRPLQAWRAFLGWRRSWFSREVIAFGAYLPLIALSLTMSQTGNFQARILAALVGLAGVACSAMIYADTGREFWSPGECFARFFGTTILLGASARLLFVSSDAVFAFWLCVRVAAMMIKLGIERRIFQHLVDENTPVLSSLNQTARLLAGQLGFITRSRVGLAIIGGGLLPGLMLMARLDAKLPAYPIAAIALALTLSGECLERYLFFRAVVPLKMPGGPAA